MGAIRLIEYEDARSPEVRATVKPSLSDCHCWGNVFLLAE